MQSDRVNFQSEGWKPEEMIAGLAAVLPKNIWLYVAQIPSLAALGTNYVLQGGTQHNLAAVKSQVDYIKQRFAGKDVRPRITVHPHCGESGAIGAAIEAGRLYSRGHRTEFVGIERVQEITYTSHRSEDTRCYFCKNRCLRTFIDVNVGGDLADQPRPSKIEILPGVKRLIVGNSCERAASSRTSTRCASSSRAWTPTASSTPTSRRSRPRPCSVHRVRRSSPTRRPSGR